MKLLCAGLNWKTAVSIREKVAFDADQRAQALQQWNTMHPEHECVLLSTCNRTEMYVACEHLEDGPGPEGVSEFLADFHGIHVSTFYPHLYFHEDMGAASHLFKVASGLDSLVRGEAQILGQVKDAYQSATDQKACRTFLHGLFQRAITVAKRVHHETELTKGRLSIAGTAVDYIKGVYDEFDDKTVLVIGAGKMAELTLTHLADLGPKKIVLCNRTRERVEPLAERFSGTVRPFEELSDALVESDIVISSTGADQALVTADRMANILKRRQNRWMAIVDIAVPRDFDPEIAQLDNVFLWNIDDLETVRRRTIDKRENELEKALKIIHAETDAFEVSLAVRQTGPVIGQLEREFREIMEQELQWLMPQLNGMSLEDKAKIEQFAHRLKNKFLHPPKIALKQEAQNGAPHGLLEAFRRIFGLT